MDLAAWRQLEEEPYIFNFFILPSTSTSLDRSNTNMQVYLHHMFSAVATLSAWYFIVAILWLVCSVKILPVSHRNFPAYSSCKIYMVQMGFNPFVFLFSVTYLSLCPCNVLQGFGSSCVAYSSKPSCENAPDNFHEIIISCPGRCIYSHKVHMLHSKKTSGVVCKL